MLVVTGLSAGYLGEDVVHGVSFTVADGEAVAVIGSNGAGKTTLFKAMCGLLRPSRGSVTLDGEAISGRRAHDIARRGLAYVPAERHLFPEMTVSENLELGAYPKRPSPERRSLVLDLFPRLGERRRQRAGTLSGGEQQMLAVGRALMADPQVLLLDEPSAGLSPALQDEVFINCRRINEAGVSIVMVEQNANRCLQICHRGYVLDQGRNAYTNSGDALLNDPKVIELYLGTLAKKD
jgi:branched-chain amino acid transport system ATP-binding protein